jgi:hypothetical protein
VFGDGVVSTVPFTIGGTDAAPTIAVGTVTGSTAVVGPVQTSSGDDDGDENEASARVSIAFTNAAGDQSRSLTIKVKVEADDGDNEAKLSISLGKVKGVAGKAVGAHTWSGLLCDGTVGTFAYSVDATGAVTVTPGTGFTVATNEGKTTVTFATGERVSIKVREKDGEMRVSVKERIRCDSPDATTNVSTSIPSDDDGDHHDGDHHGGGNEDGKHKNGG